MSKRNERQLAQEALLRLGPVRGMPAPRPRAPGWPAALRQEAGARAQGAGASILGANQHQGRAGAAPAVAGAQRDIASVMCFNCQTLGHYANQCPAARVLPRGPPFPSAFALPVLLPFPFSSPDPPSSLSEYVQHWIEGLLQAEFSVPDDDVVRLSELAVIRVALANLLRNWEFLAQDWDIEMCGRYDHTTCHHC